MLINGMNFTIGADPEVFVAKSGQVLCAHGLIPGDKEHPHPVNRGAVQVDGMALEFNIDPASSAEEFAENLRLVQEQLKGMIEGYEFFDAVSAIFDQKYFDEQPDIAKILGCEPDFNAYTETTNPRPDGSGPMRTVGGHVHVGGFDTDEVMEPGHFGNCVTLSKYMDEELGVYSILWDKDDKRRSMYGKAGSFRPKRYGMEYRTLSNAWIFSAPLVQFVYDATERAITRMFEQDETNPEIPSIIDNSDRQNSFFNGNKTADFIKEMVGA